MRQTFLSLFLLTAFVLNSAIFGQVKITLTADERKAAEGVTADQMRNYLYFVASDEMEGRNTPSRGLDTTAKFIAVLLSRWGAKPMGDDGTFFQKIALRRDSIDSEKCSLELGGTTYKYGDDYTTGMSNGMAAGS